MRLMSVLVLTVATTLGLTLSTASAAEPQRETGEHALLIVTSPSLHTQGMAMILANAMQQQGTQLNILLCDEAGNLGVSRYSSEEAIKTPPSNPAGQVKPEGILANLLEGGADVSVCAIYLPNSEYTESDLRPGVTVAAPGAIAQLMRNPDIQVFSF